MRLRARLVGLGASALLVGIVVAIPAALLSMGGDLTSNALPTLEQIRSALTAQDDGTLALGAITAVAWVAWAVLTVSIAVEVGSRLRGVRAPRLAGLHVPQLAARQLVSAAALLFIVVPASVSVATAASPAYAATAQPVAVQTMQPAPSGVVPAPGEAVASQPTAATYTVRHGDSLSAIARDQLGDVDRWAEIVDLNPVVAGNPNLIYAGTVLQLPAVAPAAPAAAPEPAAPVAPAPEPAAPSPASSAVPGGPAETAPGQGSVQPSARLQADVNATGAAPAAATAPVPAGAAQVGHVVDNDTEDTTAAPWMLAGLTGGGAVLAGSLLMLLRRRRRAQFRNRRPGRTLAAPEPVLGPVEKTITAIGSVSAPTVENMDAILRRLAGATARDRIAMADLAAVELTATHLVLHLGSPAELPAPWIGSADRYHWRVGAEVSLDTIGPDVPDQPAPYPLLVTIGVGDDGGVWLFNLEDLDVSITGDPTYGLDFARYLVAEVACNPWSAGASVDCVGVAGELAALNPDRIRVHGRGQDPIGAGLADAVHTVDRAADAGVDIATARATQAGADAWPARLLLVDATTSHPALDQLLDLVHTHAGETGTCVVVNGSRVNTPGVLVEVTADGRIRLAEAGLDLVAVGLTSDEALGCAALLAQSEDVDEVAVPVDVEATGGWRAWSDNAGALRSEHTLPRTPADPADGAGAVQEWHQVDEQASSLLDGDDQTYLQVGATTALDLQVLAPRVSATVRRDVLRDDPTLDQDLAMWFAETSPLPKLRLLGPVRATTRGKPLVKRKPYMTELLTFIALHPHGVTPAEVAEAFAITPAKTREYVRLVREWLGTNPRTGEPHLPDARYGQGAAHRGTPVYEVVDLLVDVDLFRRLRVRGQARGAAGIEDLRTALRLVEGRPFDAPVQRRAGGGWTWLVDGDRLDEHAMVAVVDVAHLVVTHALSVGDLTAARVAAETAAMAAPYEEIPRLDLAAVASAEGRHGEARRIIREEVANRTDDEAAPPELAARTEEILKQRSDWLDSKAS